MEWFFGLFGQVTTFWSFFLEYFYFIVFFCVIVLFFHFKKDYRKSSTFLYKKNGLIILDGKFGSGKTRFMSQLAKDGKRHGIFVLSNFYNGYTFCRWQTTKDLKNLLMDLVDLGDYQNFTDDDIVKFYSFDKKILQERQKKRREIKKRFPYIPQSYHCRFLILGDEAQNYFYNRESMSNFSGEKKDFLRTLHQVRHFNSLIIFGTQESGEMDKKFRKLSSFYITTVEFLKGLLYGYTVFSFSVDKEQNLDIDKAIKFTKFPVLTLNGYLLNKSLERVYRLYYFLHEKKIFGLSSYDLQEKINLYLLKKGLRTVFGKRVFLWRFGALDFHTKYNVNTDIDIYTQGAIFQKINKFFKEKKEDKKYMHFFE